ncbi:DUF2017 family protein [Microbacterium sp. SD291]|uniref:DUF2017 family protein n=1 Tax=Microbacterium sp. SD291 TaxID=2782007 RepID=UPI001A97A561|nr:DUF2017 family protein [Microbacterium sp. SD291]MBO0981489.1 DUF2017 family protein [Microbacterium sp. SD291]
MKEQLNVRMAVIEATQLARLVDDFRDLVGPARDHADPAVARLTPDVYPDDADASRGFRDGTRKELLDRRALDADVVLAGLAGLRADLSALSDEEAVAERDLTITASDIDAWLRTITALRLVIAERLGIEGEDEDVDDPRHGVYDWLAYRLEVLIEAAEELL